MKVLQINTVYGEGSTGRIVKGIYEACLRSDIDSICAYRCSRNGIEHGAHTVEISSKFDSRLHGFLARATMFKGCFSYFKTRKFLKKVEEYSPDIIHLHNLHGSYVNIPLIFKHIKKNHIPVVWTLHDCWPFTAICPHFQIAKCDKWKQGCNNCPQRKKYSSSAVDFTAKVWKLKKKWFSGVENLTIVTPSIWLSELVKESFLNEYPVRVVYNGIDTEVFRPVSSDFRFKNHLENKKIILGVAFDWGYAKGLDVFVELSRRLPNDYSIVLVGTNETVEANLPEDIISIRRTNNQKELAEIYSAADVFVNPTREEVLGLVNLEALSCGTPVITFNAGGSPECIDDTCGSVVDIDDIDSLEIEIKRICCEKPYSIENCVLRANTFSYDKKLEEYIEIYKHYFSP